MPSRLVLLSWSDDGSPIFPGMPVPTPPIAPPPPFPIPGNELPGFPHYPGHELPNTPGRPAHLPVYPFDPTHLPAPGEPPQVSQPIAPGGRYIVKWLACVGLVLVPDHTLPTPPVPVPTPLPTPPPTPTPTT